MLKSCRYCGKIHDTHIDCDKRNKQKNTYSRAKTFRSTNAWTRKAKIIKKRDGFLCQICLKCLFNTIKQYNSEGLEVHHIEKIEDNFDERLEDDNLITLCIGHHKMADSEKIPSMLLKSIVLEKKQE